MPLTHCAPHNRHFDEATKATDLHPLEGLGEAYVGGAKRLDGLWMSAYVPVYVCVLDIAVCGADERECHPSVPRDGCRL